ncbi:hypothetical protein DMH27_03010 [Raoultella planticola]|nr:hypothetical protein [Raoultella planticola]
MYCSLLCSLVSWVLYRNNKKIIDKRMNPALYRRDFTIRLPVNVLTLATLAAGLAGGSSTSAVSAHRPGKRRWRIII